MPNQLLDNNFELSNHSEEKKLKRARWLCYALLAVCFIILLGYYTMNYEELSNLAFKEYSQAENRSSKAKNNHIDIQILFFAGYMWAFLAIGFLVLSIFNITIRKRAGNYFSTISEIMLVAMKIPVLKWVGIFLLILFLFVFFTDILLVIAFLFVAIFDFLVWLVSGISFADSKVKKIEFSRYLVVIITFGIVYWQIKQTFSSVENKDLE